MHLGINKFDQYCATLLVTHSITYLSGRVRIINPQQLHISYLFSPCQCITNDCIKFSSQMARTIKHKNINQINLITESKVRYHTCVSIPTVISSFGIRLTFSKLLPDQNHITQRQLRSSCYLKQCFLITRFGLHKPPNKELLCYCTDNI